MPTDMQIENELVERIKAAQAALDMDGSPEERSAILVQLDAARAKLKDLLLKERLPNIPLD